MRHWMRGVTLALALGGLALTARADASAQEFGGIAHAGLDVLSVTGSVGGFFPVTDFEDGTGFDTGLSVGASATYWVHHYLGLRGNLVFATADVSVPEPEDQGGAAFILQDTDPTIVHYSADAVVRLPLPGGETVSWFPYALAGLGAKHYSFEETEQLEGSTTDFALNLGAGVALRWGDTGRWGLTTEVRDFISPFEVTDEEDVVAERTLQDIVWTVGVSLNF